MINCHSGIIPNSRGLDSLKWSVFNSKIVGATLHFIDKNIDLERLFIRLLHQYHQESFKEFAKNITIMKYFCYQILNFS